MNLNIIDKLNEQRRKIVKRIFTSWGIGLGIFMLTFLLNPVFALICGIGVGTIGTVFSGKKEFVKNFKSTVLTAAFNSAFDDCTFDFEKGFDCDFIFETQLVNKGNTFESDDYISGTYNGIHFERSDIDLKQVTSTGKSTTVVPIFVGQWLIFDLPKRFNSTTKVVENGFFKAGNPGGWFQDNERIKTENIAFNEKYSIFTDNPHDAFYLLTPQLMEQIMKLEKKYDKIRIGFIDGKIHILFETNKNFYEPSIWSDIDASTLKELAEQIHIIKDMADILQLEGDEIDDSFIMDNPYSSTDNDSDNTVYSVK